MALLKNLSVHKSMQLRAIGSSIDLNEKGKEIDSPNLDQAINAKTILDSSGCCSLKTEWLTTEQAARYLCLSLGAFKNMVSNGQIPFYKLGRRNRYRLVDLRELLLAEKRGATNGN